MTTRSPSPRAASLRVRLFPLLFAVSAATFTLPANGEDWPAYRHDNARSAITKERLDFPLAERWRFEAGLAPEPAWETPRSTPVEGFLELGRTQFDDAYHAVAAAGAVYFGTGAEEKLYCLDLETGELRWTDHAGGAVRLAPALAHGRVYYGADDGIVRCLEAASGATVWARRIGPGRDRMLGHGRMISRWPIRTGVLVEGDRAYFGAGIWPAEGVYMQAAKASDGTVIWSNDNCGETPESIMSPQGYLLTSKSFLFSPHGRATPGAFDLLTGKYRGPASFGKTVGGTSATICDDVLFTGTEEILGFRPDTKGKFSWLPGRQAVIAPDVTYLATGTELLALSEDQYAGPSVEQFLLRAPEVEARRGVSSLQRKEKELAKSAGDEKAKQEALDGLREDLETARASLAKIEVQRESATHRAEKGVLWRAKSSACESLALAGNALIAGGEGSVTAIDAATGKPLWSAPVDGRARGLAVAGGRLLVSTSTGRIHCFGPGEAGSVKQIAPQADSAPFPDDALSTLARSAAKTILEKSGVTRGYCLVLGCETGRLSLELAKASKLTIYAVEPDAEKAEAARKVFEKAGMNGRISIETGPLDRLSHSDWYANLIVSERALHGSLEGISAEEVARTLKPHGGFLMLGQPGSRGAANLTALEPDALLAWKAPADELSAACLDETGGRWLTLRRGGLEGAGSWTHLYANAANTACGDDELVGSPLSLLWYGRPGPLHMISRHRRAASPLTANGILFFQGEHLLRGYDAYNGLELWERSFPNVVRDTVSHDCSNLASDGGTLFVATGTGCERLDGATGRTLHQYAAPGEVAPGERWGYLAVSDGKLYGSLASKNKARSLFAFDIASGKLLWEREAKEILHPSISIADGKLYFVDDPAAASSARQTLISQLDRMQPASAEKVLQNSAMRTVICLDAATGGTLWERAIDLTGGIGGQYWSSLGSMVADGVLVLFGVYTDGHFWKEFFAGQFESRRIVALSSQDGYTLWDKKIAYRVRPLIIGDTLHAEPRAYDLHTGDPRLRSNPVTGAQEPWQFARPGHHCGLPVAAPNLMLFRSGHIGYYDLQKDSGTMHFGGQRTGCWNNFIPGNGLVLIPEASSGCMCAFPNMATVVFKRGQTERAWAKFSFAGSLTPVRRLALNLGAPGDRKDSLGLPWIGLPRPSGSLVAALAADVKGLSGGGYFQAGPDFAQVQGTDTPWLYTTGYRGFQQCSIPLLEPGDGVADYTVRLHFASLEDEPAGLRVFDVKLQGKTVEKGFDPVIAASGPGRAVVREYRGVRADGRLEIELAPVKPKSTAANGPVLCAIDIERERVVSAGIGLPEITLNQIEPSMQVSVALGNMRDEPIAGALEFLPPEGFSVVPPRIEMEIPAGGRHSSAATVSVTQPELARGDYPLRARLVRRDGSLEAELSLPLHFLGNVGRMSIPASEDGAVAASGLPLRGTELTLIVDGGMATMGDASHAIAYLKFPLSSARARGKLISAVLSITNAGNQSSNGGDICIVDAPWSERALAYDRRPEAGAKLGNFGPVESRAVLRIPLKIDLQDREELRVAIVPVNTDGVDYLARESGHPAELIVEYEPVSR